MELKLPKERAQAIGLKKFEAFGMSERSWNWKGMGSIDLRTLNTGQLKKLRELLQEHKTVHGVKMMLYDLGCYEKAQADPSATKVRNIRVFGAMLQAHLKPVPRHQIYVKSNEDDNIRLPYYVNKITYHPKRRSQGYVTPAHVIMEVMWERFGGRRTRNYTWHNKGVAGRSVSEILADANIYPENEDFRKNYETEVTRWDEMVKGIGKQFLAIGTGTDDVDGNDHSNYGWGSTNFGFLRDDGPSRVVLDVFREGEKNRERDSEQPDAEFWKRMLSIKPGKDDDQDDVNDEDENLREEEAAFEKGSEVTEDLVIEIPIHPFVVVFDLRRHLRLSVHIANLTEYAYDKTMADKLILPPESKHLVHILVEHKEGGFRDIVAGKGGGAIVLLCGPPGTGKTLTAEVYAESEEKPLYSVQASQLGTDEEELEKELTKILARGRRWNAILLIDEADVYIRTRGDDLRQNAIVGVFLRVLEYHSSILFLTTNRPDLVDDAIASRCVARIDYKVPPIEDQKKIWHILSEAAGLKLSDIDLAEIIEQNRKLAGRDIKNLLKLAQLFIASGKETAVTASVIKFVRQFKPTSDHA